MAQNPSAPLTKKTKKRKWNLGRKEPKSIIVEENLDKDCEIHNQTRKPKPQRPTKESENKEDKHLTAKGLEAKRTKRSQDWVMSRAQ